MFINSVSQYQYSPAFNKAKMNPVIARNRYKILLTQNICSPNLDVKMPETHEEREVLLEVLKKRLKLDDFFRYTNEKAKILFNNTVEEILSKRDLLSYFRELDKKIKLEKSINKDAIEYFKEIQNINDVYLGEAEINEVSAENLSKQNKQRKFITYGEKTTFWEQIKKQNINPEGKLSTQDLIDIIERHGIASEEEVQARNKISQQYEQLLREHTNIYSSNENHYNDAQKARKIIEKSNEEIIRLYPEVKKSLNSVYKNVENKLSKNADSIVDIKRKVDGKWVSGVGVYPIGEYWTIMDGVAKDAKNAIKAIDEINLRLKEHPKDISLQSELKEQNQKLTDAKKDWIDLLEYSVEKEYENREILKGVNKLKEYEYLADLNPTILHNRELYSVMKSNNGTLPETSWNEILS